MRKVVKNIEIGEKFTTWEVIALADPKKYRYLCRCSCGNEKEFYKYVLRRNIYGLCKSCNPAIVKNLNKIKTHWNSELNKTPFTKAQDFNVSKRYWFICKNNHNFKSTLRDFSLDHCCSCRDKVKGSNDKEIFFEAALTLFKELFEVIEVIDYNIKIPQLKALITFTDEDRDKAFKNYYKNEIEYLKALEKQETIIESFKTKGYNTYEIFIVNNYNKNIDTVSNLMLKLTKLVKK